jgi:hypothetical protein
LARRSSLCAGLCMTGNEDYGGGNLSLNSVKERGSNGALRSQSSTLNFLCYGDYSAAAQLVFFLLPTFYTTRGGPGRVSASRATVPTTLS